MKVRIYIKMVKDILELIKKKKVRQFCLSALKWDNSLLKALNLGYYFKSQ